MKWCLKCAADLSEGIALLAEELDITLVAEAPVDVTVAVKTVEEACLSVR